MFSGRGAVWGSSSSPRHSSQGCFGLCPALSCPPEHTDPRALLCHRVSKAGVTGSLPWGTSILWSQGFQPGPSPPCSPLMEQIWGLSVRGLLVGFHPQHRGQQPRAGTPCTVRGHPGGADVPLAVAVAVRWPRKPPHNADTHSPHGEGQRLGCSAGGHHLSSHLQPMWDSL